MATDFDPYRILEVDPSAGREMIDEAYRRQWAAYPRDPAPDARLREIQAAYRILSDPAERASYDARRSAVGTVVLAEPAPDAQVTGGWRDRVSWGLKEVAIGAAGAIALGLVGGVPFAIVGNSIADGPVKEDGNAIALEIIGSLPLELGFVLAVWLLAVRKYHVTWASIGFRKPERGSWWLPFALFGGAMGVTLVFSIVLTIIDKHPDTNLGHATYVNVFPATALVILTLLVAPLMEETFFRGFAFRGFSRRWGFIWGAVASGMLFGLAHSLNPGGLYIMFPITAIGILFAWGAYYTKSILPTIAAHFLFNSLQVISTLISPPKDDNSASIVPLLVHVLQTIARTHL